MVPINTAVEQAYINQEQFKNDKNTTEYYALIIGCSEYENKRNSIPKPPYKPFPETTLKYVYNSLLNDLLLF